MFKNAAANWQPFLRTGYLKKKVHFIPNESCKIELRFGIGHKIE